MDADDADVQMGRVAAAAEEGDVSQPEAEASWADGTPGSEAVPGTPGRKRRRADDFSYGAAALRAEHWRGGGAGGLGLGLGLGSG